MRVGPDLRFRIDWTYQRKDLPVQIVREYQSWRRIRDPEGTGGLGAAAAAHLPPHLPGAGRGAGAAPRPGGCRRAPVARLRPGVIGNLRRCEAGSGWCEVRVDGYDGWVKRSEIWGVTPDEAID